MGDHFWVGAVIVVLAGLFLLIFLWALLVKLEDCKEELTYINMEIRRSGAAGKKHWKKRRRQLWLSLLPFYRKR